MYSALLLIHSWTRWLVLLTLVYAIYRAYRGWRGHRPFDSTDNLVRHMTATFAHIQLIIGAWLYLISPVIQYFLGHFSEAIRIREIRFFGMEHSLLMLVAVVFITIGSSLAKRKKTSKEKFKTMFTWYTIALLVILVAIPWPFSPLSAHRPYFRTF